MRLLALSCIDILKNFFGHQPNQNRSTTEIDKEMTRD